MAGWPGNTILHSSKVWLVYDGRVVDLSIDVSDQSCHISSDIDIDERTDDECIEVYAVLIGVNIDPPENNPVVQLPPPLHIPVVGRGGRGGEVG